MNLSELNNRLNKNLYKSFVFYIPQSVFKHKPELIQELIEQRVVDELVLFSESGEASHLGRQICIIEVMNKAKILNENKFQLIEAKGSFNQEQYLPLLDSYIIQLNFYNHITNWMTKHADKQCFEITTEQKEALKLQAKLFNFHSDEVNRLFSIKPITHQKKGFDFSIFEKYNPDFFKKIGVKLKPEDNKKKITKTRKVLVSDQEAESFLLEHVFNSKKNKRIINDEEKET